MLAFSLNKEHAKTSIYTRPAIAYFLNLDNYVLFPTCSGIAKGTHLFI